MVGSNVATTALLLQLTEAATASAWLRALSGNSSPTMSQLMGPNDTWAWEVGSGEMCEWGRGRGEEVVYQGLGEPSGIGPDRPDRA
jgi:hypothetical protein